MGKIYLSYLEAKRIYVCKRCKVHLSCKSELISKDFMSGDGRAFLYNKVLNVVCGPSENRILRTGNHSVCDIFCKNCKQKLGWRYIWASEPEQKYKEGKTILEKNHVEKTEWCD